VEYNTGVKNNTYEKILIKQGVSQTGTE